MTLLLLFALQAAAAPQPPPAQAPAVDVRTIQFDLKLYRRSNGCSDPGAVGAIVVCGHRPKSEAYPLEQMAKLFEPGPLDAETGLFGTVRGRAFVDHAAYPNGEQANRIMVGIKLPF